MKKALVLLIGLLGLAFAASNGFAATVAEMDHIRPGSLEVVAFEVPKVAEIDIEAVGIRQWTGRNMVAYAWLLNRDTREPVWIMKERTSDHVRRGTALRKAEKVKALQPGRYELYYYASEDWFVNINVNGVKDIVDLLAELFDGDEEYNQTDYRDLIRKCFVRITSDDLRDDEIRRYNPEKGDPEALIQMNRLGDNEYVRRAFRLDKPEELHVYAIIEHPRGYKNPSDYGWIVNADTREKVWEIDRWSTERAGGGRKNRKYDDVIHLDKGNYILSWVTDDSHSWEQFNVNPPYDPMAWGVCVYPGKDFDRSGFHLVDLPEAEKPLVDLTRARDDEYMEQAFHLDKKTKLRVYCLGEYSRSDRAFVDYGWIKDASSGEILWEMNYAEAEPAGGADKNMMFDGYVTLPAGDYIAAYMTDDSHSYRHWNANRPYDPRAWGLALYPGSEQDRAHLSLLSSDELKSNSNLLVNITRVRDDERIRKKFTLDKDSRVHIYALGEGEGREMYDYGWILDDKSGRSVWEMTMRNTEPAGGANKNRLFNDDLFLKAGTYEVFYETDNSHSFNNWNARTPRDPESWGITITELDNNHAER